MSVTICRNPQEVYADISQQPEQQPPPPPPPRPRLTPEQEQMRRLQEEAANKHIREQQERAVSRALQTGQFETGFQPQALSYQPQSQQQPQPLSYQPQPQQQAQPLSYQQQPQPQQQPLAYQPSTLAQYESSFPAEPQYYEQPPAAPQYYQQTRSIRPAQVPEKFSYSQVQLGSTDLARQSLEPRLVAVEQRLQNQVSPQPQYYSPQPRPQPTPQPQINYNSYTAQPQQQTPTTPQHPQQYLIETTRPEEQQQQIVRIPRPQPAPEQSLYYRPEPPVAQEPRQYSRPQTFTVSDAPSRSAIYVQHSGGSKRITPQEPLYHSLPIYTPSIPRIATPHGQRPLTTNEMKSLAKAGFNISPLTLNGLQESSEIAPSYEEDEEEYRSSNSKRQSQIVDERKPPGKYPKRIPKPVPLTETERRLLAEQGIRNLYRVESAETKDAPVTYVLAIDNTVLRKRESDTKKQ